MAFSARRHGDPVPRGDEPERQSIHAIVGSVQSGKTANIIDKIAHTDRLCVVIVRNVTTDVIQFVAACKRAKFPVRTYASNAALNAGQNMAVAPKVLVLLANAINVRKCAKDIVHQVDFTVFVDEADKVMFGDEAGEKSFRAELNRLLPYAKELVMVTATTFNFMKLPQYGGRITKDNLTLVEHKENYCGVEDLLFGDCLIDDAVDNEVDFIEADAPNPDRDGYQLPASYTSWLHKLASNADLQAMHAINQPKLALVRAGHHHGTIVASARKARKVHAGIMTLVFTGDGVAMPTEQYKALPRKLEAKTWGRAKDFHLLSKGWGLQQTLAFIHESNVCSPNNVILVCAGILAARGVNFTDSRYRWALTHEYFLPSKSTTVTELLQGLRLLGNKPWWNLDLFRPRMMTKFSVMEDIRIGKCAHDTVIERVAEGTSSSLMHAVMDTHMLERPSVRYAPNLTMTALSGPKRQRTK